MFVGSCTPDDFQAWATLATQWIGAARVAAADSAENHTLVDRALTYWGQLVEPGEGCTALNCDQYVIPLVELTQRARGYVIAWGGEGVDSPGAWDLPWWDMFPGIPGIPGLTMDRVLPWFLLALVVLPSVLDDRQ
jgi:hypothetical protein